jgi:hypothetical protein
MVRESVRRAGSYRVATAGGRSGVTSLAAVALSCDDLACGEVTVQVNLFRIPDPAAPEPRFELLRTWNLPADAPAAPANEM